MARKKRWFYDSVKHSVPFDPISKRLIEERTGISIGSGMVGPWQAGDKGSTYYVLNVETGEKKKMGRAQLKGANWWLRAKEEARHRNELVENQRNYPWLFRKGGKAGVLKELEQVLYTDRIGGNLGHQVIDEAYSRCDIAGCTTKDLNKVLARVDERVKAGERAPGGGKKRHGKTTAHRLRVISLHDAQAECSCGGWHYMFTGSRTREQVKAAFRQHLWTPHQQRTHKRAKKPSVGKQVAELQALLK